MKLLDKMYKYEMDPASILEDSEQTRFCPQTARWTRWNQYTTFSTSLKQGYNKATADGQRQVTSYTSSINLKITKITKEF